MPDALHRDKFTVPHPAGGTIAVVIVDRDPADRNGPCGGTAASVRYDPARIPVSRPVSDASDHGGPLDEAWRKFNAAELAEIRLILDTVMPAVLDRTDGTPGEWHLDRYAFCRTCPCSPGVVNEARLQRQGRIADLRIEHAPTQC